VISRPVRPFSAPEITLNGDSRVAGEGLFSGVPNVRVIVVLLGAPGLLHAHFSDIAASRITT
jgi:hypothetical protein